MKRGPQIEPLLLSCVHLSTFSQQSQLTNASGFLFERDERLYLVTSRHVLADEDGGHFPDQLAIDLHTDPRNLAAYTSFFIPLYKDGNSLWRQGTDSAGDVDVAVIEIFRSALPARAVYCAFTPEHLLAGDESVEVGASLLVVGFPLGFHDTLHHAPVVRQAGLASSFGLRFQGQGYFLTDARTHRGSSGAPVVMRVADDQARYGKLPWVLLGVHSGQLEMTPRDQLRDEALGLNCAWYAEILMALTGES